MPRAAGAGPRRRPDRPARCGLADAAGLRRSTRRRRHRPGDAAARSSWRRTAEARRPALAAALAAGVPYVGLVASRRAGAAVLDSLDLAPRSGPGCARPAGLDIGARTPEEVARVDPRRDRRRSGRRRRAAGDTSDPPPRRPDRHRPGLRHDRRRRSSRRRTSTRRRTLLVLRHRLPDGLRRRPRRVPDRASDADESGPARPRRRRPLRRPRRTSTTSPTTAWPPRCSSRSGCRQPLLLEGEAGVGKTEAAKALAGVLDTPLLRLQCYEGIDAAEALYEWNYPRQLLGIRLAEAAARVDEADLFGDDYLVARPLLQAIEHPGPARPSCWSTRSTVPTTSSRPSCSSCSLRPR